MSLHSLIFVKVESFAADGDPLCYCLPATNLILKVFVTYLTSSPFCSWIAKVHRVSSLYQYVEFLSILQF